MSNKITAFKRHRPLDSSDPGFTIPGKTLRWINGRVAENNPGRPWVVLRKSELPKELIDHIEGSNPAAFSHGDTIRRGDLVLSYTTLEVHKALKAEKREQARLLESRVTRAPEIKGPDGRNRAKVTQNEEEDVTNQMIERFKSSPKDN